MEAKLQIIHESMLRLQCVYSFATSPEIADSTEETLRTDMQREFDKCSTQTKNLKKEAFDLADKPEYSDFSFVDLYFQDLTESIDTANQTCGTAIAHYVGSKMMNSIVKESSSDALGEECKTTYDGKKLPHSAFSSVFTFSSLLAEQRTAIER